MLDASGHLLKINRYIIDHEDEFMLDECYDDEHDKLDAAIDIARERARLYCMPATWQAKRNKSGRIVVTRYHR